MYRRLILIVACATMGLAQAAPQTRRIQNVATTKKVIALTFDDGPNRELSAPILDVLKKEQVRATFYMNGCNIHKYPGLTRRAIAEGHEVGNHTMNHPRLVKLTKEEIAKEIDDLQSLLHADFGYTPTTFRAPYLGHNDDVWNHLDRVGLPSIGASIKTKDWASFASKKLVTTLATVGTHPGGIILMHERKVTLEALPGIIAFYKGAGYSFVTVSELLAVGKKKVVQSRLVVQPEATPKQSKSASHSAMIR